MPIQRIYDFPLNIPGKTNCFMVKADNPLNRDPEHMYVHVTVWPKEVNGWEKRYDFQLLRHDGYKWERVPVEQARDTGWPESRAYKRPTFPDQEHKRRIKRFMKVTPEQDTFLTDFYTATRLSQGPALFRMFEFLETHGLTGDCFPEIGARKKYSPESA